MKSKLLLLFVLMLSGNVFSQVALVDYSFLAVPPDIIVKSVVEQPDGKFLVGGAFYNYAGSGKNHLVRLNSDGSVDASFNPGNSGPGNSVEEIALMSDGRIVIAGNFVQYNGINCYFVARLHANGSHDNTFNIPPGVINGAVWAIELHTDDKVVAGGEFFSCYGHSQPHITRFNYDGSLDTTFNVGLGFDHNVYEITALPDSRLVVGGKFMSYNSFPAGKLALLTPGGLIDHSMNTNPGFSGVAGSAVEVIRVQQDGNLLIGGSFSYHHGTAITGLARISTAGIRDAGFTPPFYLYAHISAIVEQPNNQIIAGGSFTSSMYNPGITGPARIARLNSNGTIDNTFNAGAGFTTPSASLYDVIYTSDDKIVAGGLFDNFNGETMYQQLIRLDPNGVVLGVDDKSGEVVSGTYPNPANGSFSLRNNFKESGMARMRIYSSSGQLVSDHEVPTVAAEPVKINEQLAPGIYLLNLELNGTQHSARFIIQ